MQKEYIVNPSATPVKVLVEVPDPVINISSSGGTPVPEPVNQPPVVEATGPGTVTLPIDTVMLQGSAKDLDGSIVRQAWKKISGPAVVETPSGANLILSSLQAGDYVYEYSATDNKGATATDTINLTVKPATTTGKVFPVTSTPRMDDYSRPGAGAMWWENNYYITGIPASMDEYRRFLIIDIDKGSTGPSYDWSMFDKDVQEAITGGRKISLAFMQLYPGWSNYKTVGGGKLSYPEHWHSAMQAESVKDWVYDGTWIPNYNSVAYKKKLREFYTSVDQHLIQKDWKKYVYFIDIRGYGDTGEWHTTSTYRKEPSTALKPTAQALKDIIDIHVQVFNDYRLVGIIDSCNPGANSDIPKDVSLYLLSQKTNKGDIGIRVDHWGDPGLGALIDKNPNLDVRALVVDRWKTAPIVGEPNNQSGDYADLPREVKEYHVSQIGNGNFGGSANPSINFRAAAKIMGYRIGIDSGNVQFTDKLIISLDWSNKGVAPPTEDIWDIYYQIGTWKGKSTLNPYLFLPGSKTVTDQFPLPSLPAGTYQLQVTITDRNGVRKPLPLNGTINCEIKI